MLPAGLSGYQNGPMVGYLRDISFQSPSFVLCICRLKFSAATLAVPCYDLAGLATSLGASSLSESTVTATSKPIFSGAPALNFVGSRHARRWLTETH